ncbi:MAG: type IV pilus twitching motility protein PilT [Planctomycetaceae bacterium]
MSSQRTDCPETIRRWFHAARTSDASDLHVVAGASPVLRVHGKLQSLDEAPVDNETLRQLLSSLCAESVWTQFEQELNADFSLYTDLPDGSQRFRANYFVSGEEVGACFRLIPDEIPSLSWANFPDTVARKVASFRNGLVIVSGVTGSGKSTTLAMIINMLNAEGKRVVTIEEPVEYVFPKHPGSVITQREVGLDVHSFADGLKYSLRQDPDVILVGEIRDYETAQMAVTAAETGLLVLSTLHARDAKGVISRFCDLYPIDSQNEIRAQLAGSLRAVISQHLLPSAIEGEKRNLALEVMFNTGPISSGIRNGKLQSLDNNILTGRDQGMVTMDDSIKRLLNASLIDRETAERFVSDPNALSW